ncbi:MAG: hypothetical protein AAF490_14770 [Chloroflexota bacterium]
MTARHLEQHGIPTVIIGSARDIVEQCGVPRFVFTDFPLGNPCGKPDDPAMQKQILEIGFQLLETAVFPRTTIQTPFRWGEDATWRKTFMEIGE